MRKKIMECVRRGPEPVGEGMVEAELLFPPEFIGFSGHFPNNPILPAVVQMLAAQTVIDAQLNGRTTLRTMTRAKFLDAVAPDQLVRIRVTAKAECRYGVTIDKSDGTVVSRFTLECE